MNQNQQKILELVKRKDISSMSFRAIGRELDIQNPQTVIYHIKKLKDKGLLYFDTKNRQRVSKPKAFVVDNFFSIPAIGSANCGPAMELAQEDIRGYLRISQKSVNRSKPDGLIAIKAVGESLNKANIKGDNIEDGDYVIVDCNQKPENGNYVLSIIDGTANFKQFFKDKEKKEIRLVSNSTFDIAPIVLHEQDIETSNYRVNGVVVRVVKN